MMSPMVCGPVTGLMLCPAAAAIRWRAWIGKIVSSLIGQGTNMPNIAGATQPPKDRNQQDSQQNNSGATPGQGNGPAGNR
jgi:hypothetical protein